jgi:hypothetical protein
MKVVGKNFKVRIGKFLQLDSGEQVAKERKVSRRCVHPGGYLAMFISDTTASNIPIQSDS